MGFSVADRRLDATRVKRHSPTICRHKSFKLHVERLLSEIDLDGMGPEMRLLNHKRILSAAASWTRAEIWKQESHIDEEVVCILLSCSVETAISNLVSEVIVIIFFF